MEKDKIIAIVVIAVLLLLAFDPTVMQGVPIFVWYGLSFIGSFISLAVFIFAVGVIVAGLRRLMSKIFKNEN